MEDQLQTYLSNIADISRPTPAEEYELIVSARAGSIEARQALAEAYLSDAAAIASVFSLEYFTDLLTTIEFANTGLLICMNHIPEQTSLLDEYVEAFLTEYLAEHRNDISGL